MKIGKKNLKYCSNRKTYYMHEYLVYFTLKYTLYSLVGLNSIKSCMLLVLLSSDTRKSLKPLIRGTVTLASETSTLAHSIDWSKTFFKANYTIQRRLIFITTLTS